MKKSHGFHWWMGILTLLVLVGLGVLLWGILYGNSLPHPSAGGLGAHWTGGTCVG